MARAPGQRTYELIRPVVLFGQSAAERAAATGVPERSLRRKVARFAATGMRSLFEIDTPAAEDRRRLPPAIRRAIVALKAEYPPLSLREVAKPRFFATGYTSPQPFLPPLAEVDWHPAQRLAPYWPRCKRRNVGTQEPLRKPEPDAQNG